MSAKDASPQDATHWLDVQGRALCPSATRMAKKLSVHIGCGRPQGPHPAKRLKDDIFSNLLDPKKILL